MRTFSVLAAVASLSAVLLTGCGDPAKPLKVEKVQPTPAAATPGTDAHGHEDTAKRITVAEAKVAFDKGEVVFVDTRADVYWAKEHIKGAINIPAEEAALRFNEIPKGKKVIAYCS
jgi:predicted sulfurtransferase